MSATAPRSRKIRVVVAKPGLDGHDRGAKIIARALRDAGMEVIYTGLHQTPEQIVETVVEEDAQVVGLSILSGAQMTHVPRVIDLLRQQDIDDVLVIVGGTIPNDDIARSQNSASRPCSHPGRRRRTLSTTSAAPLRLRRSCYRPVFGGDAPALPRARGSHREDRGVDVTRGMCAAGVDLHAGKTIGTVAEPEPEPEPEPGSGRQLAGLCRRSPQASQPLRRLISVTPGRQQADRCADVPGAGAPVSEESPMVKDASTGGLAPWTHQMMRPNSFVFAPLSIPIGTRVGDLCQEV